MYNLLKVKSRKTMLSIYYTMLFLYWQKRIIKKKQEKLFFFILDAKILTIL